MTKRTLAFDASPLHRMFFKLLGDAFRSRGSAQEQERVSKDDRRSESRILRAMKTIATPVGEPPTPGDPDFRVLSLNSGGGTMELEQPDFSRLQKFVEKAQWQSSLTDVIADLEDWVDAAPKVES